MNRTDSTLPPRLAGMTLASRFQGKRMDLVEAREIVEGLTPTQIRHVAARLGQQSANATVNVQAGVRLLTAVALVYLDELETRETND